ncbi:MAG: HNH endonuclease [Prosthecobacter sp.]|nr:HNH endonuclease [Prosthecobacter sp.]
MPKPKSSVPWTRQHRLMALNLYHKLPFGRLHHRNPVIVEVAAKMGRTPSSLAMKLTNFASLDPVLAARGIGGLDGASKGDREQWQEFRENLDELAPESEGLLEQLLNAPEGAEIDCTSSPRGVVIRPDRFLVRPNGPTEGTASVKVRRGQCFFRQAVLTAYGGRCGVTGLAIPELLVASHIHPWALFPEDRIDPQNGLCLSRLHDGAFDQGLITFDADLRMLMSGRLKESEPKETVERFFEAYVGLPLRSPEKIGEPSRAFLEWHRSEVFAG